MRDSRWFRFSILVLLLTSLLAPLPPAAAQKVPSAAAPNVMPPHPDRLEEWRRQGRPLPPFLTDPEYFARAGIDQPSHAPLQPTGPINALAVVVEFADNTRTVTANFFDSLVFAGPVGGRGSVRDYYAEVSYGQVDIVTVNLPSSLGWRMAPQNYVYYTNGNYCMGLTYPNNCQKLAEDIVDAVNGVVDFSQYDNDGDGYAEPIMLVHSGPGAEFTGSAWDIWSHSWVLANPRNYDGVTIDRYVTMPEYWMTVSPGTSDMTIGVFCHEMGHGFWGLPDLYDTDTTSNGVGTWSLMSYGSWNGPNSGGWGSDGSSPAWPDAWSRIQMGFDSSRLVFGPSDNYTFRPVETNQNAVLRFKTTALQSMEYFLAENRQRFAGGYDEYLPAGGLLIWHVDELMWSIYGGSDNDQECTTIPHCQGACAGSNHYLVALEQADGFDHLENAANFGDGGDPFPGTSNRTFWRSPVTPPLVNPESGSWYDSGCALDSCIDASGIACTPLSNCTASVQAACAEDEADLGDAPASQNSHGNIPMTAYYPIGPFPLVQANYPTVYLPVVVPGPRHHFCWVDSYLGQTVTGELQADRPPDQDGMTNISPTIDIPDQDSTSVGRGYDDGLLFPVPLAHCQPVPIPYTVTVAAPGPPVPRYVNVWADWNRDGDWADTVTCPGGMPAPEWAVQDHQLVLGQGVHPQITPPFWPKITIAEDTPFEAWMRISIAEAPAPAPQDGRGPVLGYEYGETEDYHLDLLPMLDKSANLSGDPLPGDLITYTITYDGMGNIIAAGVVISDVLPPGIEYVSSNPAGTYDPVARTVSWIGGILPGYPSTIDLVVQVTGVPSQTITNTAHLLWADTIWMRDSFSFHIGSSGQDPIAFFTWSRPACVSQTVSFTNLSTGTQPISFSWDLDGDGEADSTATHPTWHYASAGPYTVTLTATNALSSSIYQDVVVVLQPLQDVDVDGPISVLVGETATYTAFPMPPDATAPLYAWSNGLSGVTTTYSWAVPGLYTVAVTASNSCGAVTGTLDVLVSSQCISLTGVSISGPASLTVGEEGTYLASPEPPTATHPAYLWDDGTLAATAVYSWTLPGSYTVTVTATNCLSVVVRADRPVTVTSGQQFRIYLPLVFKNHGG